MASDSTHEPPDRRTAHAEVTAPDRRPPTADRRLADPDARRTLPLALPIFAVWTVLALLAIAQAVLVFRERGLSIAWRPLVVGRFADWYTCALFTPAFFWVARRLPIGRRNWKVALPAHLAVAAGAVVLKYAVFVEIQRRFFGVADATLERALVGNFFFELMIFGAAIAIVHAILFHEAWQQRERLAAALRVRLSEARLDALTAQLRPHFLFNTLNGISTLVHSDPAAADQMIVRLADLLRASLETSAAHEIPLADELALAERYVAIMQVRLRDRLSVEWNVAPEARAALVPHFILQPLVENALEHGIARRAGPGRLTVGARVERGVLRLSVADDGPGVRRERGGNDPRGDGSEDGGGIGLANTRLRLRQLYGEHHRLGIESSAGGGTVVRIAIPARTAPAAPDVSVAPPAPAIPAGANA
jgi:signal transduction histidine kinase